MLRSRPPERSVFGPFLAGLGPPRRCVSPFWNVGFGTSFCCFPGLFSVRVAQPSPAQPSHAGQVSPAQLSTGQLHPMGRPSQPNPSLGVGVAKALPKAFSYRIQMLRSRPPERSVFGPFLAGLGPPCRCVSPFWNVGFGTSFCCAVLCSYGPAQPTTQARSAQPSLAQASSTQWEGQASPAQPLAWALPKLCQRLFLTGFRRPILGRRNAPFFVRFWPVWGRCAAAFPVLRGWVWGLVLGLSQARSRSGAGLPKLTGPAQLKAQPSPAQAS